MDSPVPKKKLCTGSESAANSPATASSTVSIAKGSSLSGSSVVGKGKVPIGDGRTQEEFVEDLYSHQIAVYGCLAMRSLSTSNVLISGMQGLGVEIAKNLILADFKSVTLHDEGTVELWDLSGSFIFSEKDVGKNRALASVTNLQELNNSVIISTLTSELTKEQLSDFQVVVFTDIILEKAIEFNDYCHQHEPPIAFIKSEVRGLFGSVFCDFGPEYTVFDVAAEDPHCDDIRFIDTNRVLSFKPLHQALNYPVASSNFERAPLLHLSFLALDRFRVKMGRFPFAGSEEDAQELIAIAASLIEDRLDEIDEKLLRHFSSGARAVLNPMSAMFGGIVAQEVIEACSGMFNALQFFYFDSVESLPTEPLDLDDLRPLHSRYDAQISVFGSKLQQKLQDAKVFVVGSGTLGCEFLKNLALMGVCCGDEGKLTITDDGVIKKSNLSRQFLFRDRNIGQAKATVASAVAALINPRFHVEAFQDGASHATENVFDYTFWENLSVVINASVNVHGKLYLDQRCLYFQKALLESTTSGVKCKTQMIIPHLTENYDYSPPEKEAPKRLFKLFPHNIHHCLTWARYLFEKYFVAPPNKVNDFLKSPGECISAIEETKDAEKVQKFFRVILHSLDEGKPDTFQDCITFGRLMFEECFAHRIERLTSIFPENARTENGDLIWKAPKCFPRALKFHQLDSSHLQFVSAAATLRAENYAIPVPEWVKSPDELANAIDKVTVLEKKAISSKELNTKLETCLKKLPPGFRMNPIQFEMDTKIHMDMVAAIANLTARIYRIPGVGKMTAKFILTKRIPQITTCTSIAAGLVCLELYKVLDGQHKREDYRNTCTDLALPRFSTEEPRPPKLINHQGMSWTIWDKWVIKDNPSLREFLQWFQNKGLYVNNILYGKHLLFCSSKSEHADRMDEKMVDLVRNVANAQLPANTSHFQVVVDSQDEHSMRIDVPQISIYFK